MDHVSPARQHDADRAPAGAPPGGGGRATPGRIAFLALCLALAVGFAALGVWQVERLGWKRELIATVEARLAAPPAPLPAWTEWSPDDAYTRIRVRGVYLHDRETLVQAVTEAGPGWWVMTPLRTDEGVVIVNRGFVPAEARDPARRPPQPVDEPTEVSGLLRASEPGGGFLRANAPAAGRWYSRDVQAIARARGMAGPVAPFFIDADAVDAPGRYPAGGLTVVKFRDNHLVYALTWFGLSALCLAGGVIVFRHRRRSR